MSNRNAAPMIMTTPRRSKRRVSRDDDDKENESDEDFVVRTASGGRRGGRARRALDSSSDEDEEDDATSSSSSEEVEEYDPFSSASEEENTSDTSDDDGGSTESDSSSARSARVDTTRSVGRMSRRRAASERTMFTGRNSKEKNTRYDYRARVKVIKGFEKYSDDELDLTDEDDHWLVEDDDERESRRRRRQKRPVETTTKKKKRVRLKRKSSNNDDDAKDESVKPRKSSRVMQINEKKVAKTAQNRASLSAKPSLDISSESSSEFEASESETEDFIVEDGGVDDDSGDADDAPDPMRAWFKTLAPLESDVLSALRDDDVVSLRKALGRSREPPGPGRVLIDAGYANAASAVELLLERGMLVGYDKRLMSPQPHVDDVAMALHLALERGNIEFVHAVEQRLGAAQFQRGANGGWKRNVMGGTLVHSAAANIKCDPRCVKTAIRAESWPKSLEPSTLTPAAAILDTDADPKTPLMIAILAGPEWIDCVDALLDDAKARKRCEMVIRLKDPIGLATAVHMAAESGNVAALKRMIKLDPRCIDVRDRYDCTPLHFASIQGSGETISVLLDAGANRIATDVKGWIPLLYANFKSEREAVLQLLKEQLGEQISKLHAVLKQGGESEEEQVKKVFALLATVPEYYEAVNKYLSQNNFSLLDGPLNFLLFGSGKTFINAANRLKWLRDRLSQYHPRRYVEFRFEHGDPWGSLLNVRRKSPNLLSNDKLLSFACDTTYGDGVRREFFTLVAKQLCDETQPNRQLFQRCASSTYGLVHADDIPRGRNILFEYEVFGELFFYAVVHGLLLPIPFCELCMRVLMSPNDDDKSKISVLGTCINGNFTLDDLEQVDPQEASSLRYIRDNTGAGDLCLTFTASQGDKDVELVHGGRSMEVTDENKNDFIRLRTHFLITQMTDRAFVDCIRRGLRKWVVRPQHLSCLSPSEWVTALVGTGLIDADDWERHAEVVGAPKDSTTPTLFWKIVRKLSDEDKSRLLQFSTGVPLLPVGGFSKLPCKWRLNVTSQSTSRCPSAHTCFFTLFVPRYTSEEVFEQRLMTSIRHGAGGFHLF